MGRISKPAEMQTHILNKPSSNEVLSFFGWLHFDVEAKSLSLSFSQTTQLTLGRVTIFYFLSVATFGAVENFVRTWLCWKRRCRVFVSPNWLLKHGRYVQVFVFLPGEVDFVYSSLATKARVHSAMKLRKSPFLGISFPSVPTEEII